MAVPGPQLRPPAHRPSPDPAAQPARHPPARRAPRCPRRPGRAATPLRSWPACWVCTRPPRSAGAGASPVTGPPTCTPTQTSPAQCHRRRRNSLDDSRSWAQSAARALRHRPFCRGRPARGAGGRDTTLHGLRPARVVDFCSLVPGRGGPVRRRSRRFTVATDTPHASATCSRVYR